MYLFFILHKRGVDVNEVYEEELREVPTERFNEWIKEHMDDDEPPEISFDSQASFSPILKGPMPQPKRPDLVPKLNLETIPDYVTSSDEEEGNQNESSILHEKNKSLDGSKLHRPSELNSELSLSYTEKEKPKHPLRQFKEDYNLVDEIKLNRNRQRDPTKLKSDSSLENIVGIPAVSQSLETNSLNFNL
jgi:hypothetical protein